MNANIVANLMNSKMGGFIKKTGYKLTKVRPDIGLGIGIASVVAGTILACLKTEEAKEVVKETEEKINDISEQEKETGEKQIKERLVVYGVTAYKFTCIYGIPAALWFSGMGCIIGSHADLKSRYAQSLTHTAALKQFYDEYRARVSNEIGEDREKELYLGGQLNDVDVLEYNPDTGATKITRKNVNTFDKQSGSIFARNFSERTSYEYDIRSYAMYFAEVKTEHIKSKIKMGPFLTMNEVYDEYGFKPGFGKCKEGMTWGWMPEDEFIVTYSEGYEPIRDETTGKTVYKKCIRMDFNPKELTGRL